MRLPRVRFSVRWSLLALAALTPLIAATAGGRAEAPRLTSAPPITLLEGTIFRRLKGTPEDFRADCKVPGTLKGEMSCRLQMNESTLLLRAQGGGQFARIEFSDLYRAGEPATFQAAVINGVVSWIVVYTAPADRPVRAETAIAPLRVSPATGSRP